MRSSIILGPYSRISIARTSFDVFLNLREVDSLPEIWQISAVINEVKKIRSQIRFGVCAIVASRDALFGMMRVFEVMGEECFRLTRTFRDANDAGAWLVSQQSSAAP